MIYQKRFFHILKTNLFRKIRKKLNKKFNIKKSLKPTELDKIIVSNWNYNFSKDVIRKIFKKMKRRIIRYSKNKF